MKRKLLILTLALLMLTLAFVACADKAIESMTVTGVKLTYTLGETPDFSNAVATVTYNDGSTKEITANDLTIKGLDTSKLGKQTVTVTYEGFSITIEVTVEGEAVAESGDGELLSISVISSSVAKRWFEIGEHVDYSELKISATYAKATKTVTAADLEVTLPDMTTAGEKQVTVSYGGKSTSYKITVNGIADIEVDGDSIDTTVEVGGTVDVSGLKVYAVWLDGKRVLLDNAALDITLPDMSTEGDKDLVIAYSDATFGEFSTTLIVSSTPPTLLGITVNAGGWADTVVIGDIYSTAAITATARYSNNTTKQIENSALTIPALDTETAGVKTLTVVYQDKTATLTVTVLGITKVEINKNSVNGGVTEVLKDAVVDLSQVSVVVTYSDNSTDEITDVSKLTVGSIDTTVAGEQTLTVTYRGVSGTLVFTVSEFEIEIFGAELPANLASYSTNAQRFKNKNVTYTVGDANPFVFRLALQVLDQNDDLVDFVTNYTSISKVFLVDNGETEVGTEYVTVDETKNSFDFTPAAVGKTFRIETRPLYGVEGIEQDCTRSLTVQVVSAYNVTNAKELNLMTNPKYETFKEGVNLDQATLAKAFVNQNFGENYYETYGANNLKGFVIHNNLNITPADIPSEYIFADPANNNYMGFEDQFSVFHHFTNASNPSFSIYGNYFTINSKDLPLVHAKGTYNDDDVSSSDLFQIRSDNDIIFTSIQNKVYTFDASAYTHNIVNLAMRDNDPNSNDQTQSERHKRGLVAVKCAYSTTNVQNSIIEAFMIGVVPMDCHTTLNIDNSIFYNAWQGHIFPWIKNAPQTWQDGNLNAAPYENVQPIAINITNSDLTKCGGPVILAMTGDVEKPYNATAAVEVNVDASSTLWSYVTGQEAWFVAHGKSDLAGQLMAMNALFTGTSGAYGMSASFTTTVTPEIDNGNTPFANMIFACTEGNYTYRVDGKVIASSDDATIKAHNQGFGNQGMPMYKSSEGGYGIFAGDASKGITSPANTPMAPTDAALLFAGDYITISKETADKHFMGVVLEYFHP